MRDTNSGARGVRVQLWRRLLAALYDLFLVVALLMAITAAVMLARRGAGFDPASAWYRSLLLAGWWLYFTWSWTHGGRTIGMRAWRLVLGDRDGMAVGWGRATLRFFAAWLSALPAGLGFLWSLIDRDGLCWHDHASGTRLDLRRRSAQAHDRERGDDQ
jgi:uncharacterized RDD family membrane protein YckC